MGGVSETEVQGSESSVEMDEPPKRPLETNAGEAEDPGPSNPVGRKPSFILYFDTRLNASVLQRDRDFPTNASVVIFII